MARSWQQRFDNAPDSYTKVNDKRFADLPAGTTVLIPSPKDIEAEIDDLPSGMTVNLSELRRRLADRHNADGACPVMTGMNLRVVAELCLEGIDAGLPHDQVVPIWRAVDPSSALAKKLRGGPERIRELRGE